jgi:hypothetical protein
MFGSGLPNDVASGAGESARVLSRRFLDEEFGGVDIVTPYTARRYLTILKDKIRCS